MSLDTYEEIVTHFNSPTLVLAGPGAGKTYLLADRIKRLLENGVDKNTITVLTFGRDATQHMTNELLNPQKNFRLTTDQLPRNIRTMHSLGFKIIQEKPRAVGLRKTDLKVQDDNQVKALLYRDAALIIGQSEQKGKEALKCKEYGHCQAEPDKDKCNICTKYREIMSKCNRVDFDDQILLACHVLESNPDLLQKYQIGAQHLLVDEYQDINTAQFRLIELLSKDFRNGLFVVGDDAQCIYSFRGSDPKFILHFSEDFTNAETSHLAYSRRCHEKIMRDAVKVLTDYYEEWTGEQKLTFLCDSGDEPHIWQLPSNIAEAKKVAKLAQEATRDKKSVLVLAPTKKFFPLISKELSEREVLHTCPVGLLPEQVEDRILAIKLFMDWIRKPSDSFITRLAVEHLINQGIAKVPGAKKDRRCSRETIQKRVAEEKEVAFLWESVDRSNDLYTVIDSHHGPNKTIKAVKAGLNRLSEHFTTATNDSKGEFTKQLFAITDIWSEPAQFANDISTVVNVLRNRPAAGSDTVQLMTMRMAKGQEADVVVVVGLEDDIIPSPQSKVVEEARLFYVSMTRAIEKLYLLHAFKRPRDISYGRELMHKKRSRFLDSIGRPSEYKQY
jgi:DNA helicase-2/ATP-dependent DNA helicase PcrA